jgi:hypothetical protein
MITEEIINKVCTERGMTKLTVGSIPTWINKLRQEGIELRLTKIFSFWNKDGSRNYDEPASEPITKTIQLIYELVELTEAKPNEKSAKTEDKKDEPKPIRKNSYPWVTTSTEDKKDEPKPSARNLKSIEKTIESELPEFLTSVLVSKWGKMTTTDRILMFQKTPSNKIKQVKVGKDETGKILTAPYVEGNYMFREANAAFLFDWYLSDTVITVCPTGVGVVGTLYGYFSEYGKYLSRPAIGYQELNKKVDTEAAKKGATTDAIKKGLSLFGFNSDVYSGNSGEV